MPVLYATGRNVNLLPLRRRGVATGLQGIVAVGAHAQGRPDPAIAYGPHVYTMTHIGSLGLELRVASLLAGAKLPLQDHPIASDMVLPKGLLEQSVPIVVVSVDCALGAAGLGAAGAALRGLRNEGVIVAGFGRRAGSIDAIAALSVIMGTVDRSDTVIDLDPRREGAGFMLFPRRYDGLDDPGCCFWDAEAAGEIPQTMKKKKPAGAIQITRFDKKRLTALLRSLDASAEMSEDVDELERELGRGVEVDSIEVGPYVVTMNSTVKVTDLDTGTTHVYTIVFPPDADYEKGRISILSPLGTALLGYRVGETVTWEMPGGIRKLRIDALIYQPEAAGDYHL